jgi:hypothetical protein
MDRQTNGVEKEMRALRDDKAIRGIGEIADEYSIEARLLMSLRISAHIVDVDRRSPRRENLRRRLRPDSRPGFTLPGFGAIATKMFQL